MNVILCVAVLNLAIWLYLLLAHGRFWLPLLSDNIELSLTGWPRVCVIIPARNEADILDKTLPSLLNHDYPDLHVVLVDDNSDDGTANMATKIAAQYNATGKLTIVRSQSQAGWKGKVSAMQSGFSHVITSAEPPRYILFTDADIAYQQGVIRQLVAKAEMSGNVLTSLMVKLRFQSIAEQWLIPAFVYFFQLLYPFRWVNNSVRKMAAAAGGCMLVRYDALVKTGGLAPIRAALIDDCALGKLLKQQGPIWLGLTKDVHSLRAYPLISDIRAMVARTAYDQLRYSPLLLIASVLGMVFVYIFPLLLICSPSIPLQLIGLASWLLMSITYLPTVRFYKGSVLNCLMLPVSATFYLLFTLDSAWQYSQGRGGFWKGRVQAV